MNSDQYLLSNQDNYIFLKGSDNLEDESRLIRAAQAGNQESFNTIAMRYQNLLFNTALRILGQKEPAEDAVQETFLSAFQHIHSFRGGCLKAWLVRITINKCYDQVRRKRRIAILSLDEEATESSANWGTHILVEADTPSVEEHVEAAESRSILRGCVKNLPLESRTILGVIYEEEKSYHEASSQLNIPLGTVKSRLARARARLRIELGNRPRI